MSAFVTTEAGVCPANCGEPIEVGDLVVMVNDKVVHLECEDPEKAIAAAETMPFDVDDAADPVRAVIAHSMIGAGLELTPNDVDRLRVILETPKQGQPDVHWPCDCVPDLGEVHCHACSTAAGRTVRWADAVHGPSAAAVTRETLAKWLHGLTGTLPWDDLHANGVRLAYLKRADQVLEAFDVREKADRG